MTIKGPVAKVYTMLESTKTPPKKRNHNKAKYTLEEKHMIVKLAYPKDEGTQVRPVAKMYSVSPGTL